MLDLSSQALRVDAIAKISESEGAQLLHALNGDTIKHVLKTAFEEADADGNGTLDPDEIADVLIYALLFCESVGIDPEAAIRIKLEENAEEYPVEKARGSAKKYSKPS